MDKIVLYRLEISNTEGEMFVIDGLPEKLARDMLEGLADHGYSVRKFKTTRSVQEQ